MDIDDGVMSMDDKKTILVLVIVVIVLAIAASLVFFNSNLFDPYKEVGGDYVRFPTPNENVRFTGTYLGPYDGIYNIVSDYSSGVIQVGHSYAIVSTDKLKGLEGQTVTVEGHFLNDNCDAQTVQINNQFVTGESFYIENVK